MINHFERLQLFSEYKKIPTETRDEIEKRALKSGKKLLTNNIPVHSTSTPTPQQTQQSEQPDSQSAQNNAPSQRRGILQGIKNLFSSFSTPDNASDDIHHFKSL